MINKKAKPNVYKHSGYFPTTLAFSLYMLYIHDTLFDLIAMAFPCWRLCFLVLLGLLSLAMHYMHALNSKQALGGCCEAVVIVIKQ